MENNMNEELNEVEVYEEEPRNGFSIGKLIGGLLAGILVVFGIRGIVKKVKSKRNKVESENVESNNDNK